MPARTEKGTSTDGAGPAVEMAAPPRSPAQIAELLSPILPGRERQIKQLVSVLNPEVGIASSNAVFVYGTAATGKTRVTTEVLKAAGVRYAAINCIEACSCRIIFEQILNQLNPTNTNIKCESLHNFLLLLAQILSPPSPAHHRVGTTYLVFDNAERLRSLPGNILAAMLRLSELVGVPLCSVLISSTIWEKFRGGTGYSEPHLIHFPAYGKDAALRIMDLDCPAGIERGFYGRFSKLLWDVFHGPCKDLNELRHLVALLFPIYHAPVLTGEVQKENSAALYKNITKHLQKQLNKLYLRETSSVEWGASHADDAAAGPGQAVPAVDARVRDVELPFLSKHLLVAAYLASYNPASTDQRIFAKRQPKHRRKKSGVNSNQKLGNASKKAKRERLPQHLLGPKPFPLDRMLAILFSLVQINTAASAEIYSQISSLATLRMLVQVSGSDNLDAPRYKCLVPIPEIKRVAASIDVEVGRYLYDGMLA